jgi:hypothetical protein
MSCNFFLKVKPLKIILILLSILVIWIITDLNYPYKTDLKNINAPEMARLDEAMWRSYYERKPLQLFLQSAELMRIQFKAPFCRSNLLAFHAAKAAFIFKGGKNRSDYEKALPNLTKYFEQINAISDTPFDTKLAAKLELEWWIIRRYRQEHPPAEWEKYLAEAAAAIYHKPAEKFKDYAHFRTEAMLLRDKKGDKITENDWQEINNLLQKAWSSFRENLS